MGTTFTAQTIAEFTDYYQKDFTRLIRFVIHRNFAGSSNSQDIAQEAMIVALNNWETVEPTKRSAFVRTVASRRVIDDIRSSQRNRDLVLAMKGQRMTDTPDCADDVILTDESRQLIAALQTLPPQQQEVMAWKIDGFTPAQIAESTGQPAATVRSNLRHARARLSALLGPELDATHGKEERDGP